MRVIGGAECSYYQQDPCRDGQPPRLDYCRTPSIGSESLARSRSPSPVPDALSSGLNGNDPWSLPPVSLMRSSDISSSGSRSLDSVPRQLWRLSTLCGRYALISLLAPRHPATGQAIALLSRRQTPQNSPDQWRALALRTETGSAHPRILVTCAILFTLALFACGVFACYHHSTPGVSFA